MATVSSDSPQVTPSKHYLQLTPKAKAEKCVICMKITNSHERHRLYDGAIKKKTITCHQIENVLNVKLDINEHTNVACRLCVKRVITVLNKTKDLKALFEKTQSILASTYAKTKRMMSISTPEIHKKGKSTGNIENQSIDKSFDSSPKPVLKSRIPVLTPVMQDIVNYLHTYVPNNEAHENYSEIKPVKITSGGDYLTFERHKKAQELHCDGRNASRRLEGLIPNMELFHFQAEWIWVIWKVLYKANSHKDVGTLFAARNAINARNVTTDPHHNYYAADELLNKYTAAYLVSGALEFFGMDYDNQQATRNIIIHTGLSKKEKAINIRAAIRKFLQEFVNIEFPKLDESAPMCLELKCRVCGKEYRKGPGIVRRHEKEVHDYPPENEISNPKQINSTKGDSVLNYTKCALALLLLRLNMNDAIRMGDGNRIYENIELSYLYFKATGCYKYAHGSLETLAQIKCLLSPRLAYRLKWNRTVNTSAKVDENYPKDLDVEHDNKIVKRDLKSYRGEITEKITKRISRSVDTTDRIMKKMDKITGVRKPKGKHKKRNVDEDVDILVKQFKKANLFSLIPGREHSAFPNFQENVLQKLNEDEIKNWFFNTLRDVSARHFYDY